MDVLLIYGPSSKPVQLNRSWSQCMDEEWHPTENYECDYQFDALVQDCSNPSEFQHTLTWISPWSLIYHHFVVINYG